MTGAMEMLRPSGCRDYRLGGKEKEKYEYEWYFFFKEN